MPKEEWGVKRVCPNCATRFYDLKRDPMTCPSCEHSISLDSLMSGKGRTLVADKIDAKSVVKVEPEADATEEVAATSDNDDTDLDLGDDVLDDDDDDDDVSLEEIADVAADEDDS